MLASELLCPHCQKSIKMSKPLQTGHDLLCSHCGQSVSVPADSAAGDESSGAPSSDRQPVSISNRQLLCLGLVVGGLMMLLIGTVSLVLYFAGHKIPAREPMETVAAAPSEEESEPARDPHIDVPPPPPLAPPPPVREHREAPPVPPDIPLMPTTATAERQQASWLPREQQEQVNKTIDRGVQWLKEHQDEDGCWGPRLGLVALPALTLLECGVPADDDCIQKALRHIRRTVPKEHRTYDLSLVILFLDRLGDPADKKLIQTCALRLAAGQMASGGWSYGCPILPAKQRDNLLTVMRSRRPKDALDLFVGGAGGSAPPGFLTRERLALLDKGITEESPSDPKLLPESGLPSGSDNLPEKLQPSPEEAKRAFNRLPPQLRKLPSLLPPKQAHRLPHGDNSDNSNTQFAILGLLAAAHHDLPLERTLALIVHRFHASQVADGRWNYHFSAPAHPADTRPAMTGAGLLGLAVQYGLAADHLSDRDKKARRDDPAVEKGFAYLSQFIGKPIGWGRPRARGRENINLYFLWTVERCGVLYQRQQIDGKAWYPWGAELLLDHQNDDGSWNIGGYYAAAAITPTTDTCFALLFLKRANLAKELTRKLEFFIVGKQLRTKP